MKAYLIAMRNHIKEELTFFWDIVEDTASIVMIIIVTYLFWSILLDKFPFPFEKKHIFLFLFYQGIALLIARNIGKLFFKLVYYSISGRLSQYLLYPLSPFLFIFFSKFDIPIHRILEVLIYLLLAIKFGLRIDSFFFIGLALCFLSALIFIFFLSFVASIALNLEAPSLLESFLSFSRITGQYPSFIYRGFLFVLLNILTPAFALGSLQLYFILFKTIKPFVFSFLFSFALFLISIPLFKRGLRRFEGYGV